MHALGEDFDLVVNQWREVAEEQFSLLQVGKACHTLYIFTMLSTLHARWICKVQQMKCCSFWILLYSQFHLQCLLCVLRLYICCMLSACESLMMTPVRVCGSESESEVLIQSSDSPDSTSLEVDEDDDDSTETYEEKSTSDLEPDIDRPSFSPISCLFVTTGSYYPTSKICYCWIQNSL